MIKELTEGKTSLPVRWEMKKINEVCQIGDGNHSSKYPKSSEMLLEGVPFIRSNNLVDGELSWKDIKYISKEKHITLKKGHLKTGDILFTNRGQIGKLAIVSEDFNDSNLNSQIAWFRCIDNLSNRFLFYFLLSPIMKRHYSSEQNGAALQQFTITKIKKIQIPIPPLPQQKQIVAILDKAFAAIDTAKANAEQNLQNAKELFESYLQNIFENKGDDWEEKTLGEVVDLISGQHIDAKNYNIEGKGIGYLTGPSDFGIKTPSISKWTEYPKRNAIKDDVLITVKGSGVGKINLMSADELCISRQLMAIRPKDIEVMFLYTFMSTKYKYFQSLANGAAIPGISRGDVLNLVLSLPTLEQQKIIVKKTDSLSFECKKLKAIYKQKIADLDEMKKSILQKAFSGQLTTTN